MKNKYMVFIPAVHVTMTSLSEDKLDFVEARLRLLSVPYVVAKCIYSCSDKGHIRNFS